MHDVPCPHPWLGIGTPASLVAPDELVPELAPALASSPLEEPPLEVEPEPVPEDDDPPLLPPLEDCPPDDPDADAADPPELLLPSGLPLKPGPPPPVGAAALHPVKPIENPTADSKANPEIKTLFMTAPRLFEITDF